MLLTVLLILVILIFFGSLFYRPYGTGYYSYGPSLLIFLIVVILLLYVLGVL